MKKTFIFAFAALAMLACSDQNAPSNSTDKDGALSGKFSIGPSKRVVFSQGNLQYQASTKTWRFALNQYDVVGMDNTNISATYSGWIDLFGWGTGNNPTKTSTNNADYSTFVDWGSNAINNGGNKAEIWRTLSCDEWVYLLEKRSNAAKLQGSATVCGINGYAILPDNWSTPSSVSFVPNPGNWSTNVYSLDSWKKMESAGAVLLPAGGLRIGNQMEEYIEYLGVYASSSKNGFFSYESATGGVYTDAAQGAKGFSVRLVQDVE